MLNADYWKRAQAHPWSRAGMPLYRGVFEGLVFVTNGVALWIAKPGTIEAETLTEATDEVTAKVAEILRSVTPATAPVPLDRRNLEMATKATPGFHLTPVATPLGNAMLIQTIHWACLLMAAPPKRPITLFDWRAER